MMFSLQWIWCWLAPLHILQHPLSRSWETNLFYSPQSWSLRRIYPGSRHSRDAWNFPLLLWHIIHGVGDQRSWHNHMCLYKSQYDPPFEPFTDWWTIWRGWKPFLAVWTFDYLFLDLFDTKLIFQVLVIQSLTLTFLRNVFTNIIFIYIHFTIILFCFFQLKSGWHNP